MRRVTPFARMRNFTLTLAAAAVLFAGSAAHAAVIISHSGANDPATEGFTFAQGSNWNGTSQAVSNDPIGGLDAWEISDSTTGSSGDFASFDSGSLGAAVDNAANNDGWVLRTRARVLGSSGLATGFVQYGNPTFSGRHSLDLGVDTNGNAVVTVNFDNADGGASYNTNTTGYVLYELVRDPTEDTAHVVDLFVNGAEVLSDISVAGAFDIDTVRFGDNTSGNIGGANYNLVEFQTGTKLIPEPASVALLGLGGMMLLSRRRRV